MQLARDTQTRSVGEKVSPKPWLSLGASVSIIEFVDFKKIDEVKEVAKPE